MIFHSVITRKVYVAVMVTIGLGNMYGYFSIIGEGCAFRDGYTSL